MKWIKGRGSRADAPQEVSNNEESSQQQKFSSLAGEEAAARFIEETVKQTIYIASASIAVALALLKDFVPTLTISRLGVGASFFIGTVLVGWSLREGVRVFQALAGNLGRLGRYGVYDPNVTNAAKRHLRLGIIGVSFLAFAVSIAIAERYISFSSRTEGRILVNLKTGAIDFSGMESGQLSIDKEGDRIVIKLFKK